MQVIPGVSRKSDDWECQDVHAVNHSLQKTSGVYDVDILDNTRLERRTRVLCGFQEVQCCSRTGTAQLCC